MEKQIHNVLFTGGLDSTYRLCELAIDDSVIIQPIYLMFPFDGNFYSRNELQDEVIIQFYSRLELEREIEAQDIILKYIKDNKYTKAEILPIKRIHRDSIPRDKRVLDLFSFINGKYQIGWQYFFIALYARWVKGVELCQEEHSLRDLEKDLVLKTENGICSIDKEKTNKNLCLLFENVTWPIFYCSRDLMIENLKKWGYYDVIYKIWFCYDSIDGTPCGYCDNCQKKIMDGLTFLFDASALKRRYIHNICRYYSCNCSQFYDMYVHKGRVRVMDFYQHTVSLDVEKVAKYMKYIHKLESLSMKRLKKLMDMYKITGNYNPKMYDIVMKF